MTHYELLLQAESLTSGGDSALKVERDIDNDQGHTSGPISDSGPVLQSPLGALLGLLHMSSSSLVNLSQRNLLVGELRSSLRSSRLVLLTGSVGRVRAKAVASLDLAHHSTR